MDTEVLTALPERQESVRVLATYILKHFSPTAFSFIGNCTLSSLPTIVYLSVFRYSVCL